MIRLVLIALLVFPLAAGADLLVLRGPDGSTHLTNRGGKRGFKVVSRYKEFRGSSALGLKGRLPMGRSRDFDDTIRAAAKRERIEPSLVKAVIRAESAFNPRALSRAGAMGLMQLMPETAAQWGVEDAYDPIQNIGGGTRHLRYLMDRYRGEIDHVLAAYNAGTVPVDRVRGIPNYPETREYVRRVRSFHQHYAKNFEGGMPRIPGGSRTVRRDPSIAAKLESLKKRRPADLYGKTIVLHGPRLELR